MAASAGYSALMAARIRLWQGAAQPPAPALAEFTRLRRMDHKATAYQEMAAQNIACVNHHVYGDVRAALGAFLPRRFVLKPLRGHSSFGVYLIQRRADGSLFCRMHKRRFADLDALAGEYEQRLGRARGGTMSKEVIIEDYIRDGFGFDVPLDYKVYAFATGTPVVMQRYAPSHLPKEQWSFAFYDGQGRDLGAIRDRVRTNPDIPLQAPDNFDDILRSAQQIVTAMHVSFARVDLYAGRKKVLFGEITPLPNLGKESYIPEYDALLGRYWTESLEQLGISYGL